MKKPICLLLALSLLCAGIALAEEKVIDPNNLSQSTTVTFDVPEPVTDYTVTIPASVAFVGEATTTDMTVTIGADSTLAVGATLQVTLESSANSFQLKQGGSAIAYQIEQGGSSLSAGSAVLSWTQGEEIPAAATLNLEVTGPIDDLPYGSYTDTLTFKATVSATGFTGDHEGFEDGGEVDW